MTLRSGEYLAKTQRRVVVWPAADADGDGPEVWVERFDSEGRQLERSKARDAQNRILHEYLPPEGFQNRPGYDHTDNYVQVDARGNIVRQPNGEAICLKPGRAVVYNADGTVEYLDDEYAQHVFFLAHDSTGEQVEETDEEKTVRLEAVKAAKVAELERQLEEVRSS
jgi:hypothetical protein